MKDNKKKFAGLIIAVIGSVMILASALNYIFKWGEFTATFTGIGLVNFAIGTAIYKKAKQSE